MAPDRRTGREQFLGDDIAVEETALAAAIALRPGHADPAPFAKSAAEIGCTMRPEVAVRFPAFCRQLLGDKATNLPPQRLGLRGQLDRLEMKRGVHCPT